MSIKTININEAAKIFGVSVVTMRRYIRGDKWGVRKALLQENKWARIKFDKEKLKALFTPDHTWVCSECKKEYSRS